MTFAEYDSLSDAQRNEVREIYHNPAFPQPVGFETTALFGFLDNDNVAAWAWGSNISDVGELHITVLPEYRSQGLGKKLCQEYLQRRNSSVERYDFTVNNPWFENLLNRLGFIQTGKNEFTRGRFSNQEMLQLSRVLQLSSATPPDMSTSTNP